MRLAKRWIASALLLGLASCQTSPPAPEVPAPATPVAQPGAPAAGSRELQVVAEESLLQIFVYRGGTMARMGHNHVIASHHLKGRVFVGDRLEQTRFDIAIPVADLTIDEPALREQAGADFPAGVPQSARDGTRKNMLSAPLLDGTTYPEIRLRATDVAAAAQGYDVGVEITIKDQVRNVRVPMTVSHEAGVLTASGEFALKQSELGLKPFSVMMGALQVIDDMRVQFSITARE
ncbi:MAG TPA: YceI family protein [Steroidobacteraceae bacterium]|jgi:polyisoprenoid-binding protein YceI|nr:YceI family protein [Steroidobacteraceae bacterium]